ncbi:hypothetical protein HDU83_005787 [Entophlyctis luteolus]|nr:hypothetical protein HDU83_005787 [Entophlyctis luteolus]
MLLTRTADTIAQVVCKAVEDKKATIVNKGKLNPTYAYFSTAPGSTGGHTLITGSAITLSETSSTKYYTVATDLIIFNDDGKYVLLYERCPHKNCGHPARKVLNNEFTYGGSLSLPGGFFNPKEDIDINGHPDFDVMSKRLLIKELYPYSNWSFLNQPEFVGVEFNNFRDIRWRTSQDYVPTVTLVFKVKLRRRLFKEKGLPTIWRMKGDICERGRWVDIEIVKSVHRKYGNVYETFNNSYNEYDLDRFITKYLFLDQRTKLPKNKEKSENAVLRNVAGNQNTIEHNEKSDYEFSDFAFDHIHLIMKELGGYLLTVRVYLIE